MSELGTFGSLPFAQPYTGLQRRSFESTGATVNDYVFEPGARFPFHRHPQKQITLVLDGEVEMTIGDRTTSLGAGGWSIVGGDVEHGITAGRPGARILAIIVPRRDATPRRRLCGRRLTARGRRWRAACRGPADTARRPRRCASRGRP